MRFALYLILVVVCTGCLAAQPLGGPVSVRIPASPTPQRDETSSFPLPGGDSGTFSLFGPPEVVTPVPDPATYRDDVDVRELYRDLAAYSDVPLRYRGTVWTVVEQNEFVFVQVKVHFGPGPDEWRAIVVMFPTYRIPVDTSVVREGVRVVVWGRPRTMLRFSDDAGQEVEQPLLLGDRIEVTE